MAKNYVQVGRMASQFVDSDLLTVIYQAGGSDAEVLDGTLVVPGDFANDPIYGAAYTAGSGKDVSIIDINTRVCALPADATAKNVCVVDLATVPTAVGGDGNVYRIGTSTIGLKNPAGNWSRARVLRVNDTFYTGEDNCTAPLTVGQYATVDPSGKWKPAATAPTTAGLYCKVMRKDVVSQGINGNTGAGGKGVTSYFMYVADIVGA